MASRPSTARHGSTTRKLLWFAAIYVVSVVVVAGVAYGLRAILIR